MYVTVGRIGRPHGIRGEVTIEVTTDDPDARFAPGIPLETDRDGLGPLTVDSQRRAGALTLLRFVGYPDRTAAEQLRGIRLMVDIDTLAPPEDPEEFYDHQLIGLTAQLADGTVLGTVTDVLHAPAASVLTVSRPDGPPELVPFVAAIVPTVDLPAGTLTIDPPDGMFS